MASGVWTIVFESLPQPAFMPCPECGVSLERRAAARHTCTEEQRLAFLLVQLRQGIESFERDLADYLTTARGRFEVWYAERQRRRRSDA